MAVGILTPQCGTIMTLISPGDCILECGMWLWNRDSEFTKWQHPAMWYVALGWHAIEFTQWQHPTMWHVALESWHWIWQVAAPCNMSGGSGMTCHWIWNSTSGFDFNHITAVDVILHQFPKFYPNRTTLGRKKWHHVYFQDGGSQPSWILGIQ